MQAKTNPMREPALISDIELKICLQINQYLLQEERVVGAGN